MQSKMTHTEACELVEDALERAAETLTYIRLRLAENPNSVSEIKVKNAVAEVDLLCQINYYGAFLKGARSMLRTLEDQCMLNLPTLKGYKKGDAIKPMNKHYVKAVLKLIKESARNLDWFLHGSPGNVELCVRPETDAKGKVVGATAKFMKKEVKLKEV